MDGLIAGNHIEDSQGVDVDDIDSVIGLVVQDACHVGRHQGDIQISADNLGQQLVGRGHHGEFVVTLGLAFGGLVHQGDKSHGGGAF